jgi:hypothetical protein
MRKLKINREKRTAKKVEELEEKNEELIRERKRLEEKNEN